MIEKLKPHIKNTTRNNKQFKDDTIPAADQKIIMADLNMIEHWKAFTNNIKYEFYDSQKKIWKLLCCNNRKLLLYRLVGDRKRSEQQHKEIKELKGSRTEHNNKRTYN